VLVERTVVLTPIGGIGLMVANDAVVGVSFGETRAAPAPPVSPILAQAARQMADYFAGERTEFDLPVEVTRGSAFDRAVWSAIAAIAYGETRSYGDIARSVGEPGGAQAVGLACNRNPLPIIVGCHRVIGSDGKLIGFGGGLRRKQWLLNLEARIRIEQTFLKGLP
jgi:methylated-DNA-[protein]-cysteine S-methyltransferase